MNNGLALNIKNSFGQWPVLLQLLIVNSVNVDIRWSNFQWHRNIPTPDGAGCQLRRDATGSRYIILRPGSKHLAINSM